MILFLRENYMWIVPILAISITVAGWFWQAHLNRKATRTARRDELRAQYLEKAFRALHKLMMYVDGDLPSNVRHEMFNDLNEAVSLVHLYGSLDLVKAFNLWWINEFDTKIDTNPKDIKFSEILAQTRNELRRLLEFEQLPRGLYIAWIADEAER